MSSACSTSSPSSSRSSSWPRSSSAPASELRSRRRASSTVENPRVELEEHYYNAKHTKLLDLGLEPHFLSDTLVESMFGMIESYKDQDDADAILPRDRWGAGVGAPSS